LVKQVSFLGLQNAVKNRTTSNKDIKIKIRLKYFKEIFTAPSHIKYGHIIFIFEVTGMEVFSAQCHSLPGQEPGRKAAYMLKSGYLDDRNIKF